MQNSASSCRFAVTSDGSFQTPVASPARYAAASAVVFTARQDAAQDIEYVSLKLHQQRVRRRSTIDSQDIKRLAAVLLHRFQDVARLPGD